MSQLRIKSLWFKNFRGYESAEFSFGEFSLLVGPNGVGKTTILDAITLLCSSLDFEDDAAGHPLIKSKITPEERTKNYLKKNIRNVDSEASAGSFVIGAVFDKDGERIEVILNQDGWVKNELKNKKWWWHGLTFFAQFDSNMTNFQLSNELWSEFARAWEAITGFKAVDPERYEAAGSGCKTDLIIGFNMLKPTGKIHCRKGSAGEKKIMKSLSQIVSLEKDRQPDIVLIDNMEMHIGLSRHNMVVDEVKKLFAGKQIIATTHSPVLIRNPKLRDQIIDIGGTNELTQNVVEYVVTIKTNDVMSDEQRNGLLKNFKARLTAPGETACHFDKYPEFLKGGKMGVSIRE